MLLRRKLKSIERHLTRQRWLKNRAIRTSSYDPARGGGTKILLKKKKTKNIFAERLGL